MTSRKATLLPPSIMHDVELDRVVVGDGCGERAGALGFMGLWAVLGWLTAAVRGLLGLCPPGASECRRGGRRLQ